MHTHTQTQIPTHTLLIRFFYTHDEPQLVLKVPARLNAGVARLSAGVARLSAGVARLSAGAVMEEAGVQPLISPRAQ